MKRIVCLFLLLAMALALTACGEQKSAAVRKTESMISAMGEVSSANLQAVLAVQAQVATLTPEERAQVSNIALFDAAWVEYLTLRLLEVGAWSYPDIDYGDVEEQLETPDLTLFPDGTYVCPYYAPDGGASWSVTADAMLLLTDVNGYTEQLSLEIRGDEVYVERWAPHAQIVEKIRDTILIVDVNNENWTDYMEFAFLEREQKDLFGEPVGYTEKILVLRSKMLEQGWVCYDMSDDFLFQIYIPQHDYDYWYDDGNQGVGGHGDYDPAFYDFPFGYELFPVNTKDGDYIRESRLTLDDIQMVGIRGKLTFIREECVTGYSYRDGVRIIEVGNVEIGDWLYVEGNEY